MCGIECLSALFLDTVSTTLLGWNDLLTSLAGVGKSKHNACRTLHRLVEGAGVTLKLALDPVHITIRRLKPVRICEAWWPTLTMHSWVTYLFENHPKILLAGRILEDRSYQGEFQKFWEMYRRIEPMHPVYESGFDTRYLIPYAFHGDEGRGKGKIPFMVFSFQPLISHLGSSHCNDSTQLGSCSWMTILFLFCFFWGWWLHGWGSHFA